MYYPFEACGFKEAKGELLEKLSERYPEVVFDD
jgi:hypothetical protein